IEEAGRRGVAVRLAYNADFRAPIPVPPPPETAPEDVERLSVPTKPIAGIPDLMPQVRRPRPGGGLDGVDELDRRLLVARGERDRCPRVARARARLHARLRAALVDGDRRRGRQG